MILKLKFIRETANARLYERADGQQRWFPRSVCHKTMKWPPQNGQPPIHEVDVADWFLEKNPWPEGGQQEMSL